MTVTHIDDARGPARTLTLSTGASRTAKKAKQITLTWAMFVDKIREPVRTKESYKEYLRLPKSEQDQIKDVGWFVGGRQRDGKRGKEALESRDLLTLDVDFADEHYDFDLGEAYSGYAFACYTTHKHSKRSARLRLVLPLLRKVTPEEYLALAHKVASWWDIEVFDDTTYQPSRVMYWPSASADGDFEFIENNGVFIDPDQVLAEYDDWQDVASYPVSSRRDEALGAAVKKAADPLAKRGPIGDFCRAYSIPEAIAEFLPEVYVPGGTENRYTFTGGSTSNGAIVYNDGRFLYSNHGTDIAGGRSVNAFDLVRLHRFCDLDAEVKDDATPTTRPSYNAMADLVNTDDAVAEARVEAMFDDFDDDANTSGATPEAASADEMANRFEYTDDDIDALKTLERNEDGAVKNHITNSILILKHDKRLKGAIAWNEFAQDFVQVRDLPGYPVRDHSNGDLWVDKHDSFVTAYVHKRYEIEIPRGRLIDAMTNVGTDAKFHPVRSYLNGLAWDGETRLDSVLVKWLEADDTGYTRAVTRKTLVAAVARVFNPGVKFDTMLILEGSQGVGKSSFLNTLACGWFTDNVGSFGKDSVENLKGKWIAEVGELTQFKKADVEHIKAFLSRQVDRMREAYARRAVDFPRQSVCIGTTNDNGYLEDSENRRFWPVKCNASTFVGTMPDDEVAQVWAEAVAAYRSGEPLTLDDPKLAAEARAQQRERQSDQDTVADLVAWLDQPQNDDFDDDNARPILRENVSAQEVWEGFYSGRGRPQNSDKARIRKLFKMLEGWTDGAKPKSIDGKTQRVYSRR